MSTWPTFGGQATPLAEPGKEGEGSNEAFQEEDPKRAKGDYTGRADHSRVEPGPRNDGGKRHGEDAG
ncbi:MAG TPA: hypothetical protein VG122_05025 [Gemmata sp.]|nr:hypothetical protein [Gemmata sp.]